MIEVMISRRAHLLCLAAIGCPVSGSAQPAAFPLKALNILVPFGPGAGGDQHVRILAAQIAEVTGVAVVVSNVPGGNGAVAYNTLRNARPDGHTILMTSSTTQVVNPVLMRKPPFEPGKDVRPVSGLLRTTQVMVVRSDAPVVTVAHLIQRAKERPGMVSFASPTSSARLATELFGLLAGIQLLHVPYKSTPPAVTDLVGGQVDFMLLDAPTALSMIEAGKLKALAVTSATRHRRLPKVPTLPEAGVTGYEFSGWTGVYVLPETPPEIVDRLHQLFSAANRSAAAEQFLRSNDAERFDATPQQLARIEADDLAAWRDRARKIGLQPE